MGHIRFRPVAEAQYRAICEDHPRAREAIEHALLAIGYAGADHPVVPNTGGLRAAETRRFPGLPRLSLIFSADSPGEYWIEEIRVRR